MNIDDKIKPKKELKRRTIGAFEPVKITRVGGAVCNVPLVTAKIDTGAFSGVVYAKNIIEIDGVLNFDLLGDKNLHFVTSKFHVRRTRNTHGGTSRRYLTEMTISIDGEEYKILIGLDDRSKMMFNVLLGRAFLNKFGILVDTQKNISLDKEWQQMGERQ